MHLKEDVGYALRQFAAAPGFTVTAVLTLALGIGLAIGIPATIFAGRAMARQLFGVTPYNPAIMFGTTAVLSLAALLAALIPHRAASLDPLRARRTD